MVGRIKCRKSTKEWGTLWRRFSRSVLSWDMKTEEEFPPQQTLSHDPATFRPNPSVVVPAEAGCL